MGLYDMLDHRIHRTQMWGLLPDAMHAVVTAATVADGPAPFQIFPQWLGKQSKRLKHRRWLRDMCQRTRWTHEECMDTLPMLRARLFGTKQSAGAIVDDLLSLKLTRDDMLETLVETAWSDDPAAVGALDTKTKAAVSREWKKRMATAAGVATAAATAEDDTISLVDVDDDSENAEDW
jgi:hypothetical protein